MTWHGMLFSIVVSCLGAGHLRGQAGTANAPLTRDHLDVYRAYFKFSLPDGQTGLAPQTTRIRLTPGFAERCSIEFSGFMLDRTDSGDASHTFSAGDADSLGIAVVDPTEQERLIKEHDPAQAVLEQIRKRKSVKRDAGRKPYSLVRLSEILFDRQHQVAVISYSYQCGSLCGGAGIVVFERIDGVWTMRGKICDQLLA